MVADALSRKSSGSLAHINVEKRPLIQELHKLVDQGLMMKISRSEGLLAQFKVSSVLRDRIKAAQSRDPVLVELKENSRSRNSLILPLMMKVFYGSVEDCVVLMWIIREKKSSKKLIL